MINGLPILLAHATPIQHNYSAFPQIIHILCNSFRLWSTHHHELDLTYYFNKFYNLSKQKLAHQTGRTPHPYLKLVYRLKKQQKLHFTPLGLPMNTTHLFVLWTKVIWLCHYLGHPTLQQTLYYSSFIY